MRTPTHKFPKGNQIAKQNNNQRKKRIRKSSLRKTLAKIQELEPKALENIKKSVEGQSIDKSILDTSKWLIQQLQALSKSASQDEAEMNELRWQADKAEESNEVEEEKEEEEVKPRFSLTVLPKKDDLQ